jgi:predicted NAD/FAD-dependent oxidoreductase
MSSLPAVIVGAGLSGLLLARALQARGERVVVLEKSRGFGGRLATKRVGDVVFDQGAQFFTVREPAFVAEVETWRQAGWVADWPGTPHRRLIGQPAMTAVPKGLAAGLDIRREHKVTAVSRAADGTWTLALEQAPPLVAARVLLTCPVPQALALLDAGAVVLPSDVRAALDRLTYHPCLALLAILSGPSAVPPEGLALSEGPVRWLADNVKKGVAHGVPAAVTIHAAPTFSSAHYAASEAEVAAQLLPAVQAHLGAPVVSTTLHRWKFSEPKVTHPERFVWLGQLGLGFAGDAFGGPKVEGAALSGFALAAAVAGEARPKP